MERATDNSASLKESSPTVEAGNGRMILLLIAGIPVIMILAASWMWYFVVNGQIDLVGALGTANRGELVQPPRQAMEAGWRNVDGKALDVAEFRSPFWTIVVPQASAVCEVACERRLYETRQIHQSLGKELGRVQRMLVTNASGPLTLSLDELSDERPMPADFATYLAREQRGMTLWRTTAEAFSTMFPELSDAPESWYLMDPNGWVMMRYDPSIDYKDVISDLKFLIKNSNG